MNIVGRRRELAALGAMVERFSVVVVRGALGIGKTALVRRYVTTRDSVLVELDGVDAPEELSRLVARALGGGDAPNARAFVARTWRTRPALVLVLDGLDGGSTWAAAAVTELAELSKTNRIIVTSRESVAGFERSTITLEGLSTTASARERSDAAALLTERVRASGRALKRRDAERVARFLDGVPLAIEIAAPLIAAAPSHEELDGRFGRTVDEVFAKLLARHALIDREALIALSVFPSWIDIDLAKNFLHELGAPTPEALLSALVEGSLATSSFVAGTTRIRMSSLLRAHGTRTLTPEQRQRAEAVHERLALETRQGVRRGSVDDAYAIVHRVARSAPERAAQILLSIGSIGGATANDVRLETSALARLSSDAGLEAVTRARVHARFAAVRFAAGDFDAAMEAYETAAALASAHGADEVERDARLALAAACVACGEPARGRAHVSRLLALDRTASESDRRLVILLVAQLDAISGHHARAMDVAAAMTTEAERARDYLALAWAQSTLGVAHVFGESLSSAARALSLAGRAAERAGTPRAVSVFEAFAAVATCASGDVDAAERTIARIIESFGESTPLYRAPAEAFRACIDAARGRNIDARAALTDANDFGRGANARVVTECLEIAARFVDVPAPVDPRRFRSSRARALAHATTRLSELANEGLARARKVLAVARDGAYFTTPAGKRVDLGARPNLRRLLARLVAAREGGGFVPGAELAAAMWPEVRPHSNQSRNNLRVAAASLRALGLGRAIQGSRHGYRLTPTIEVVTLGRN